MYIKKTEEILIRGKNVENFDFHLTKSQDHFNLFRDSFNTLIEIENEYTNAFKMMLETVTDYKNVKTDNILTFDYIERVTQFERHTAIFEEKDVIQYINNCAYFMNIAYKMSELAYDYNTKQEVQTLNLDDYIQVLSDEFNEYARNQIEIQPSEKSTIIKDQFITFKVDQDSAFEYEDELYGVDTLVEHFLTGIMHLFNYIQPIEKLGFGRFKAAANFKRYYITEKGLSRVNLDEQ